MKNPQEIKNAFQHIAAFYPNVEMVVFDKYGQWQYFGENFEQLTFDDRVNVNILELASDSVNQFPSVFVNNY